MARKRSWIWKISEISFRDIVANASSYRDVAAKLSANKSGTQFWVIKSRIEELDIDISHFDRSKNRRRPAEDVFVVNSNYSRHSLVKRLIRLSLIQHKNCDICGLGRSWNKKRLVLQIDHINGIANDNRLENLRFLCPNCHSQTDTYGAKNRNIQHDLNS